MTFKYFTLEEFACKHTGENNIDPTFVRRLDELRAVCGFPFVITSGYRDPSHPTEARKSKGGVHTQGIAADIAVSNGVERAIIIRNAIDLGFNGIGVAKGFIHVDTRSLPQVVWTY
jgi:zinc D-Ala-D-Ala carboxypeptidase